jgi:hypothetical protein
MPFFFGGRCRRARRIIPIQKFWVRFCGLFFFSNPFFRKIADLLQKTRDKTPLSGLSMGGLFSGDKIRTAESGKGPKEIHVLLHAAVAALSRRSDARSFWKGAFL